MEKFTSNQKLTRKYNELIKAFDSFSGLLKIDLSKYETEQEVDGLKNGQIQKFEYTVELLWKFLKSYLYEEKGTIVSSPKDTFREFAPHTQLSPNEISQLIEMINDRNKIAHEYKDYIMEVIYPQLAQHEVMISKVIKILKHL